MVKVLITLLIVFTLAAPISSQTLTESLGDAEKELAVAAEKLQATAEYKSYERLRRVVAALQKQIASDRAVREAAATKLKEDTAKALAGEKK